MDLDKPKETEIIDIGEQVYCDICNKDYSKSDVSGGIIFESKVICPDCSDGVRERAREFGEEHMIKDICPPDMSFKDFCLRARGGDNTIKIMTF